LHDLADYHENLSNCLRNIPKVIKISSPESGVIEVVQDYVEGLALKERMTNGDAKQVVEDFERTLQYIAPALGQRSIRNKARTGVPLDSHPDNFVISTGGEVHYIDITPPYRILKDGGFRSGSRVKLKTCWTTCLEGRSRRE